MRKQKTKTKKGALYAASMWMLEKHLGRPAKVMDLADALGISGQTGYNKSYNKTLTEADIETISTITGIPLYVVGMDSKSGSTEIRTFPFFESENVSAPSPEKVPINTKIIL